MARRVLSKGGFNMNRIANFPLVVFTFSFVVLWLAAFIGGFLRKRLRPLEAGEREDFGVIEAATLTLLALIIGFTFSMAVSRYDQRKNYEEAEANAIGTEYVRADLLPGAEAARVRELLKGYLDQRVLFYTTRDAQQLREIDTNTTQLQNELWSTVEARLRSRHHACPGRFGHERCVELAGVHSGRLVEPHSNCGVVANGSHRYRLQPVDRLRSASNEWAPVSRSATCCLSLVLSHSRH